MKHQVLFGFAFTLLATGVFATAHAKPFVVEVSYDRLISSRVAEGGSDRLIESRRVAEGGSDRLIESRRVT
ncbi:hypothetical protein ACRS3X_08335 [Ectopseudomonas hydrolytica]|uniref:hypothetical protein n=1 Tax=Ectopseudomonas hydrolytica TaxID=2493633 RepID=UPI003EE3D15B